MMTIRWTAVLMMFANAAWTWAAEPARPVPQPPPLLSHDALEKRQKDPTLRLLDARPKADYDKGHIPGALWVDLKALQALANSETIVDQDAWSTALAPLGIGPDMEVYLYDADRQHDAGRVWWLLSYAGVEKAGLVDGGFPLWTKEGRPVVSETPKVEPREFAVHFHSKWVATREDVRKAIKVGGAQIIDARTAAEYRGEVKPKDGSRAGHIPSAVSFDAYDLVDAEGRLLDPSTQRKRLVKAGVSTEKPLIIYVGSGGRSGLVIFALRRLDIPARHYAHGITDWKRDPTAPVIEGSERGQ